MNTRETLIDLAIREFHCDPEKITAASTIQELGIDSLGLLEFIFRLEEIFNIRIDNDEAEKLKSLGDIEAMIERLRTAETVS